MKTFDGSNSLFDCKTLPANDLPFVCMENNNGVPINGSYQNLKKAYYEQFVSNGYEYIILNIHAIMSGAEEILTRNNFVCISSEPERRECCFIAYRKTNLRDTFNYNHDIVICCMLTTYNSYEQVEKFIDFYKKQGVEKIFFYYCDNIKTIPSFPEDDIAVYLEWNFHPFYLNKQHHIQMPLYNMFYKKISPKCNWSIFCDVDEFLISLTSTNLKEHLSNKHENVFSVHKASFIDFNSNIIVCEKTCTMPQRGKTIAYKGGSDFKDFAKIHKFTNSKVDENLILYHNKIAWFGKLKANIMPSEIKPFLYEKNIN